MDFQPIGRLHSPFKEKFIVPRQPGLVGSIVAELMLLPPYNSCEAVRELEQFSHLWLIFLFHQTMDQGWQPTVRPPRLGGNKRVGVFASRSPFRPNPIGLSAVELLAVKSAASGPVLEVKGVDLIDGTPILDIKPYLPYADAIPSATAGFAEQAPQSIRPVRFTEAAGKQLASLAVGKPQLEEQIVALLAADPRPAYRHATEDEREYGALFDDVNIRWKVTNGAVLILAIEPAAADRSPGN